LKWLFIFNPLAFEDWSVTYGSITWVESHGSIENAIAFLDGAQSTLVYSTNQTLTANLTIPANIELLRLNGAVINHGAYTISYAGSTARWPDAQVFNGTGLVTFGASTPKIKAVWYGSVGDGTTDCTAAVQSATDSSSISMSGYALGRPVSFGTGTFLITGAITSTKLLNWEGAGRLSTEIIFRPTGGASTMLTCIGLTLRGMHINGTPLDTTYYFRPVTVVGGVITVGDTAFSVSGNIDIDDIKVSGFKTVFNLPSGGYYHKVANSHLNYFGTAFNCGQTNNFQVNKTKFNKFDYVIVHTGGSGPLSFSQCSFEEWTGIIAYGTSGGAVATGFSDNYFENGGPTVVAGHGLGRDYFTEGLIASGVTSLNLINNSISLQGIRYVLSQTPACTINSTGNRFNYWDGAAASCEAVFKVTGLITTGVFADYAYLNGTETGGSHTTTYLGLLSLGDGVQIAYDPIAGTRSNSTKTTTLTATGMTTSPTGTASYVVAGSLVSLDIPYITGTSNATTFTIGTLPTNARPTAARNVFVRINDNGGASTLALASIGTNGTITLYASPAGAAFTASGAKSVQGQSVAYVK